jgi:hypothetical protein
MKSFKGYITEKTRELVAIYDSFNPPTIHDEALLNAASVHSKKSATLRVYSFQTEGYEEHPLNYDDKIRYMRKMFPQYGRNIIRDCNIKDAVDVAVSAYNEGYTKLTMLVRTEHIVEFKQQLHAYNGIRGVHGYYKFSDGIQIVPAPSALHESVQRNAAANNDLKTFAEGCPKTFGEVKELFNAVRTGMGLKESHSFRKHIQFQSLGETRERYISGEIYNIGERIISKKDGLSYTIKERGPNYITCISETGGHTKFFIQDVIYEESWEDGYERRVVRTTDPERLSAGYDWRIKGKDDDARTIKYFKKKPDFDEFTRQMKRVAGHEFGA